MVCVNYVIRGRHFIKLSPVPLQICLIYWMVYGVLRHFQQYFSYIVAVLNIPNTYNYVRIKNMFCSFYIKGLWCLTPLSTIFQLYRGGVKYTKHIQLC